jgi:CDP-glucose 4,6-dehydratase
LGEKLLQGQKQFAEAWNFAPTDDDVATVLNVVHHIQSYWPRVQYEIMEEKKLGLHEANLLKLDCSKATTILKWKNVWKYEQAVEMTAKWYQAFCEEKEMLTNENIRAYEMDAKRLGVAWAIAKDRING